MESMEYCLGANWVSITHELVGFILENKELIYKMFHATLCADEFLYRHLSGIQVNTEKVFSLEDDYFASLRLIDWKRGNPYVWRENDYEELMQAPHLFARKFDETVDAAVIESFNTIMDRQRKGKSYEK